MTGGSAQDDREESLRIQGNVLRIQRWGAEDDKSGAAANDCSSPGESVTGETSPWGRSQPSGASASWARITSVSSHSLLGRQSRRASM